MKTASSRRQNSAATSSSSRHGRGLRSAGGGNGNGHAKGNGHAPAVSAKLASWLKQPRRNLIGGNWIAAASGQQFDVFNPADASVITRVPDSDREDINRAVAAARKAFESGPWPKMTPSERGKLVWRIGDLILEHADELADLE